MQVVVPNGVGSGRWPVWCQSWSSWTDPDVWLHISHGNVKLLLRLSSIWNENVKQSMASAILPPSQTFCRRIIESCAVPTNALFAAFKDYRLIKLANSSENARNYLMDEGSVCWQILNTCQFPLFCKVWKKTFLKRAIHEARRLDFEKRVWWQWPWTAAWIILNSKKLCEVAPTWHLQNFFDRTLPRPSWTVESACFGCSMVAE